MAKSKYETSVAPYLDRIKLWVAKGAAQREVAEKLGITEFTLSRYKGRFEQFAQALEAPQGGIDDEVEAALYRRCTGYEYEEVITEVYGDGKKHVKKINRHLFEIRKIAAAF